MNTDAEDKKQEVGGDVGNDNTAVAAALSVHYIVIALYTLPALAGVLMILMLSLVNNADNNAVWWIVASISLALFLLHLLAVKGLRARKRWGYNISLVLSLILLLMFPFGTVLGAILLSQLIKFRF